MDFMSFSSDTEQLSEKIRRTEFRPVTSTYTVHTLCYLAVIFVIIFLSYQYCLSYSITDSCEHGITGPSGLAPN